MPLKNITILSLILLFLTLTLSRAQETIQPKSTDPAAVTIQPAQVSYSAEQLYLFDIFKNRRSVRKFKPTPIPEDHIVKMLDVARSAPTARNQQPWKFLVIRDRDKLNRLQEACVNATVGGAEKEQGLTGEKLEALRKDTQSYYQGFMAAPLHVVVLVDRNSPYHDYNVHDGALAAGYLLIAARALGYGSVYTVGSVPAEITKSVLNIPDNFEQICYIPIGVPESWPDPPKKKSWDEVVAMESLVQGIQ